MDDVKIASKRRNSSKNSSKRRHLGQYLFDVIIKTLLCASILAVDFTLFANAGSYNLFSTSAYGNMEAIYIYAAIGAISFILMFVASFIRPLENIILSAVFALFAVALINQFAVFEKKSGLLLLFNGIFTEDINIILYENSHLIIAVAVFLIIWIVLAMLGRSFLFYLTIASCGLLGWLISEAYFNTHIKYFNEVAGLPNLKKENMGKNIIFLSFNDLTSINNLKNLNSDKQKNEALEKAYDRALGFYSSNDFTLYPNALVEHPEDPFLNLILSYNADDLTKTAQDSVLDTVTKESYFDFKSIQPEKIHLRNNGFYDMLRKKEYKINTFQTRGVDACYVNNELAVSSCNEKINLPITLNSENITLFDKTVVLASQWLESTGLIPSVNPLLKLLEYAGPIIPHEFSPKSVELGKIYSYNSIKIFDKLIDTIDRLSGNQAYFAIIDLPSDNYIYDEYCNIKPVSDWVSAESSSYSNVSLANRKTAYADQLSCLYGSLQKFIQQLDVMGELDNTTIIIQGLNNPLKLNGKVSEYYKQIQSKRQVTLAIKQPYDNQSNIDYSVCSVPEIIDSVFFSNKDCKNYGILKTSDKNIETVRKAVDADKVKDDEIKRVSKSFNNWFKTWVADNDMITTYAPKKIKEKVVEEAPLMDEVIEDIPEEKLKSISAAADEFAQNVAEEAEDFSVSVKETVDEVAQEAQKSVENVADKTKKIVDDTTKSVKEVSAKVEKPSKIEELAKKTYDEISANVDKVVKQKNAGTNKKENLIDKINSATKELSSSLDNTFKNVTDKVIGVFDRSENNEKPEVAKPKEDVIEKLEDDVAEAVDVIEEASEEKIVEIEEDIVAKTKKAIKEKEEIVYREQFVEPNQEVKEKVAQQSEALREVLEAPVAEGQDLSPEELKKLYRNKIKNAVKNTNVQVEVIER